MTEPTDAELIALLGDRDRIREIFMAHGFTIKEGQTDLKQYVYDAADALLHAARAQADSVCYDYAKQIAESMWATHYKADAPHWESCDSLMGVLSQISNMMCGLSRAPADSVTAPAGPSKSLPYEPTSAMLIAARERDPALPIETVRAIYWSMWRTGTTPPAQAAESVPAMSDAARDLLAERARQVQEEGWTPEHDDEHSCGEMAEAAACYAASARVPTSTKRRQCPGYWPWAAKWWKPSDQRRDLIKAGALILAELERIDRAASKQGSE